MDLLSQHLLSASMEPPADYTIPQVVFATWLTMMMLIGLYIIDNIYHNQANRESKFWHKVILVACAAVIIYITPHVAGGIVKLLG